MPQNKAGNIESWDQRSKKKMSIRIGDDTQWWIISQSYSWLFSIPQPNSCFAIYVRCNTAATATKPQRFSSPIEFITHILIQFFPLTVCLRLIFSKTTLKQNNHFATLLWNLGVSPGPERRSRGQRRRGERASSGPPISLKAVYWRCTRYGLRTWPEHWKPVPGTNAIMYADDTTTIRSRTFIEGVGRRAQQAADVVTACAARLKNG